MSRRPINAKRFRGSIGSKSSDSMTVRQLARYFEGKANGSSVSNAYANVSTVYSCVRAKHNALTRLDLRVSDLNDEVLETGPMVEFLEQPNSSMGQRDLLRAISSWLDLFGVVYLVKRVVGSQLFSLMPVCQLEMTEQRQGGQTIAFHYHPLEGGRSEHFMPDEVHVIRDPDYGRGDLNRAMGPREAAALAISQHYQSDLANEQSLKHGAGGGMGLRTEGNLTQPQKDALEQELRERFSGSRNRHRWLLLEGAMSVEKLFSTFAEMEFTDLKYYSREDICVSFGLNPLVLGYGGREGLGSGQHTEAAHQIVWTDTHLPRAQWIADELGECIAPYFDQDASLSLRDATRRTLRVAESRQHAYRAAKSRGMARRRRFILWFDASAIAILQRASLDLAKQAGEWIDKGVPLNKVLAAYDLPFEDVEWGDTWWKPMAMVDVQSDTIADDPPTGDPVDDPALPPEDEDKKLALPKGGIDRRLTEDQLSQLHAAWWKSIQPLIRQTRKTVERHFGRLRAEVLGNLERVDPQKSIQRSLVAELLFDLTRADEQIKIKARPLVRAAVQLGGDQSMMDAAVASGRETGDAEPFNLSDPNVASAMRRRENRVTGLNATVHRRLKKRLEAAVDAGESTAQLAEAIRKEFNFSYSRASTIARTEIAGAVEEGRHEGRKQAGVPLKSWLYSRKENNRPWHKQAEEQTHASPIAVNAEFVLPQTGNSCQHPRATGVAEDDINCGCTTLSRYPDDKRDGRLLSHLMEFGFASTDRLAPPQPRSAA